MRPQSRSALDCLHAPASNLQIAHTLPPGATVHSKMHLEEGREEEGHSFLNLITL